MGKHGGVSRWAHSVLPSGRQHRAEVRRVIVEQITGGAWLPSSQAAVGGVGHQGSGSSPVGSDAQARSRGGGRPSWLEPCTDLCCW